MTRVLQWEGPDTTANAILTTLRDVGPILGLAAAVYLLAPHPTTIHGKAAAAGFTAAAHRM